MNALKPPGKYACFSLVALLLSLWLFLPVFGTETTGQFEVYCDGVGIFLSNVDGMSAPGKLVLFSRVDFPPGTVGGNYIGQGKWTEVFVFRDGCVPDGKCPSIANGKVWIDAWDTSNPQKRPPNEISGEYEIDSNGKHLEGRFVAKQHVRKHPLRLCE